MVVDVTHEAVWQTVSRRYWSNTPMPEHEADKGSLMFFSSDTGTGKTTGFRLAIKRLWDTYWSGIPVLILVPTRKDADEMYREMEAIEAGCAGVWTQSHDPRERVSDPSFEPAVYMTKDEASRKKCLILTHNNGKAQAKAVESWVGRRDLVIVDEYPTPVDQGQVSRGDFFNASDAEVRNGPHGDLYREAAEWAGQQGSGQGLSPLTVPDWASRMAGIEATTREGEVIQTLAKHILAGRVFQSNWPAPSWSWYEYCLPFEGKAVVFSATAAFEGWHLDPTFRGETRPQGQRVDYRQVEAIWVPWPSGVQKYHKKIVENVRDREQFVSTVRELVTSKCFFDYERCLVVCPKGLRSDIERALPQDVKVTNWGRDVGSNEYRDCDKVFLISEFHQRKEATLSKRLGHSKALVTLESLRPGQNVKTMGDDEANHYRTHLKQMIARGSCRNVDADWVAAPMRVWCMIDRERFSEELPALFPGIQLVYPVGAVTSGGNRSTVSRLIEYLDTCERDTVTASELDAVGIPIKGGPKKRKIDESAEAFRGIGWRFVASPDGGGKGNQARFERVEAERTA